MKNKNTTTNRTEKYLNQAMKNMRLALPELSMEQFAIQNMQILFGMEREEYLQVTDSDKANGYYSRSLRALMKNGMTINIPRTRNGGFAPIAFELIKMNQDQVNELCLTLYKKGMTSRDVSDVMEKFFGNSMSHTTINELAEKFHDIRLAWQNSKLEEFYSVIFCDCIFVTVRRGDSYEKEAVYVCYGVNENNKRELLGLEISPTETIATWKDIFNNIKQRGVKTTSLVVADGIIDMEEVVLECFKKAEFQKCVVHKERNILNAVRPKEKAAVASDLKEVFNNFSNTDTLANALIKAKQFCQKWEDRYPNINRYFDPKTIEYYFTYIKWNIRNSG
jgi:putative transposase